MNNTKSNINADTFQKVIDGFHKRLFSQIDRELKAKKISNYRICTDLNFSNSSFTTLMKGERPIQTDTLLKIVSYLNLKVCIDVNGDKGNIIDIKLKTIKKVN